MENLKRYAPQLGNGVNYMGMGEVKDGTWVKFSDIKELLTTAHNKQSEAKAQIAEDVLVHMSTRGHLSKEDVIFFDSLYRRLLTL